MNKLKKNKNFIIIDDYFEDPFIIRNKALKAKYYTKENHPGDIAQFPGYRTDYINKWDENLYSYLVNRQLDNVSKLIDISEYTEYWTKFSFSFTKKDVVAVEHKDFQDNWNGFKKFFGGVIYLTPEPPKNTGTVLKNIVTVDNKFNRYVLYDATLLHSVENSFGETINNSRMVLTHFIYFK